LSIDPETGETEEEPPCGGSNEDGDGLGDE
jgi:hypothetical protein